jgi:bacterioferritin
MIPAGARAGHSGIHVAQKPRPDRTASIARGDPATARADAYSSQVVCHAATLGTFWGVNEFLSDVSDLRRKAREHIDQGPVTDSYGADRERVIAVLNEALATELVCVLRYKRHFYMAEGLDSGPVAAEFAQHATEEQGHADMIAARIVQLQGEPDFNPETLMNRSHAEYVPGTDLLDMVKEDLVAERVAISSYGEVVQWLGNSDVTTRRMLEGILAVEEEHADDLLTFLKVLNLSS